MFPRRPSKYSVFMLQANQIVAIEIEKISRALIRRAILLLKFEPNGLRVFIARFQVVDGDRKHPIYAVLGTHGSAEIGGEGGDTALPREIVADESNARRQRQLKWAVFFCRSPLRR
jgi:hypothetical protein